MERLRIWAADPMTWRDEAWLLVALPLALTLSLLVVLLLVLVVTGVAWWYGVGPIMVARSRLDRALLTFGTTERLEQRVEVLTETRNESLDHSAAELRRIERDLHDGAQARLVGLGMTLGMAADLIERDPEGARRILDEARHTTGAALGDLRDVVHGIHPAGAGRPWSRLGARGPGARPGDAGRGHRHVHRPAARARSSRPSTSRSPSAWPTSASTRAPPTAWVELTRRGRLLQVVVGDDGSGGADPGAGTGMRGVARRLAAFDGTMRVSSPIGGPTLVTLEVPCASSSPRTTPSSGTA